jgi:hypothetical protein
MAKVSWKKAVSASWKTAADWSPGRVPSAADDAVISVAGSYTVAIASISVAARSLTIGNSRAVLALSGGGTAANLRTTAAGSSFGTIVLAGNAHLTGGGFVNNGTIAVNHDVIGGGDAGGGGIAFAGTLTNNADLDIGNSGLSKAATVTVAGLVNRGGGTIHLSGGAAQATLNVGAAAPTTLTGFAYLDGNALLQYKSGGIKNIGANSELSLDGAKARVALAAAPGVNSALGGLAVNNGFLNLENFAAVQTAVGFTNNEEVALDVGDGDGGSRLILGGTLTNNNFLDLGNDRSSHATTLTAKGLVNNGSIDLTGGAGRTSLDIAGAAPTTLIGSYRLTGNAVVDFGGGGVKTIAADSQLVLDGPRARMALAADTTANGALTTLTANFGSFVIGDGSVRIAGSLANNGQLLIDSSQVQFGRGGSNVTIGRTLTNDSILNIGNTGIFLPTSVTVGALINHTTINLSGAPAVQATLAVKAAAPTTLTGSYFLTGDALLQYGSGAIRAIGEDAVLSLDGALSRVAIAGGGGGGGGSGNIGGAAVPLATGSGPTTSTALTTLATNAGTFVLADGAAVVTTTPFDNTGTLQVDATGAGGSSLALGGKLTNSGNVAIGNAGIVKASNVKATGLANTGSIGLTGSAAIQATLNIDAAAPTTLTGNFSLRGDALLQYKSGAIKGIAAGSSLSLDGAKSRVGIGAAAGNTALTQLAANAGSFALADGAALATTVAYNNTGTTRVDANFGNLGGASLTIVKALTNAGPLQIGSTDIVKAVTVKAASLVNTGNIDVTGGPATATLNITGNATNNASLGIDSGFSEGGGGRLTVGGTLTNNGVLTIGNDALARATTATVGKLANAGTVDLTGSAGIQATLKVGSAAPATLTGSFNLEDNALLQYASGSVAGIGAGATLSLDGGKARVGTAVAPASNSALARLAGNAGLFVLVDGASATTTTGFNNTGTARIDTTGNGGSRLNVGLTLTNSGFLQIGNSALPSISTVKAASLANTGTIELDGGPTAAKLNITAAASNNGTLRIDPFGFSGSGGGALTVGGTLTNGNSLTIGNDALTRATTATVKNLANTGTITLTGSDAVQAALKVNTAAPTTLTGNFDLNGDALLQYANGAFIAGIGVGASLSLDGAKARVAVAAAPASNSALTKLGVNAGTFTLTNDAALTTTVAFNNNSTGTTQIGGSFGGGGKLTIGGALTNSGSFQVGGFGLTKAVTVTAASLINNSFSTISVQGAGLNTATLKLNGASSDAGTISINGGGILVLGNKLTVTSLLSVGDGGRIKGGTLSGPGSMASAFSATATLDGVTIDAGATFTASGVLTVSGVVVNGTLKGNFGSGTLDFAKPGTDSMTHVQGFGTIGLADGGANKLTLTDANFTDVFRPITVNGGSGGNVVDASGLTGTNAIVVNAGAGADVFTGGAAADQFVAGGKTKMTGRGGADQFGFAKPGALNVVTDYADGTDQITVSNAGFNLGLSTPFAPTPLPAGLFAANAGGTFGSAAQRFAYNTGNGKLFFDKDGNKPGSAAQLVATLTGDPTLTNLFFVA